MKSNWHLKEIDINRVEKNSLDCKLDKILTSILYSKSFKTPSQINNFLYPNLSDIHSPFRMSGMLNGIERVKSAINDNEKIGIFSDSDLDGITSLTILKKLFDKFGVNPYIRYLKDNESYGLTNKIIDEFHENNINLIITVDSGIRDINEINYAKNLGIEVIVSDHHEQDKELPDAIIINPKQKFCKYPFKQLAGVGVAFKLSYAFLQSYMPLFNITIIIVLREDNLFKLSYIKNGIIEKIEELTDISEFNKKLESKKNIQNYKILLYNNPELHIIPSEDFIEFLKPLMNKFTITDYSLINICNILKINFNLLKDKIEILNKILLTLLFISSDKITEFIQSVLELVSIGSIADIVPLIDENRTLVKYGIELLKHTNHPGLSMLKSNNLVNSKTIGWEIAPLLNSPGRFGQTNLTAQFFLEKDKNKLPQLITEVKKINLERKNLVQINYLQIIENLQSYKINNSDNYIFIKPTDIPEGIAGLIANRLSEKIGKPVIISVAQNKDGIIKGSGRSNNNIDFFSYIEPLADLFTRIGGHSQAFGFTVKQNKFNQVIEEIDLIMNKISVTEKLYLIDLEIDLNIINTQFIQKLSILEPFGNGNEEPIFLVKNIDIKEFIKFGNENIHGKYKFHNNILTAIGWNFAKRMEEIYIEKKKINFICTLENNSFKGKLYPRIILIDLCISK